MISSASMPFNTLSYYKEWSLHLYFCYCHSIGKQTVHFVLMLKAFIEMQKYLLCVYSLSSLSFPLFCFVFFNFHIFSSVLRFHIRHNSPLKISIFLFHKGFPQKRINCTLITKPNAQDGIISDIDTNWPWLLQIISISVANKRV